MYTQKFLLIATLVAAAACSERSPVEPEFKRMSSEVTEYENANDAITAAYKMVVELQESGALHANPAERLKADLYAARVALAEGNDALAIEELGQFEQFVYVLVEYKRLTEEQGDALVSLGNQATWLINNP